MGNLREPLFPLKTILSPIRAMTRNFPGCDASLKGDTKANGKREGTRDYVPSGEQTRGISLSYRATRERAYFGIEFQRACTVASAISPRLFCPRVHSERACRARTRYTVHVNTRENPSLDHRRGRKFDARTKMRFLRPGGERAFLARSRFFFLKIKGPSEITEGSPKWWNFSSVVSYSHGLYGVFERQKQLCY